MPSQKNKAFKTFAVVSLFTLLIISSKILLTSSLRMSLVDLSTPALKLFHAIWRIPKRIIPFASLRDENKALKEKIALLNRKAEEMKVVYNENEHLKELLDFKKAIPYTTVAAQVIGRDASNWSGSLIIGKGSIHGISRNKAALSARGLVGRIAEVGRYSSKILLITDPDSKVGVFIERNRQGGILIGRPDGKCRMIYISLDSDVSAGDKVITAGFGSVFPKGILVGEIAEIGKEPGRLYKYAVVNPAQDLSKLEEVLCIR